MASAARSGVRVAPWRGRWMTRVHEAANVAECPARTITDTPLATYVFPAISDGAGSLRDFRSLRVTPWRVLARQCSAEGQPWLTLPLQPAPP